MGPEVAIKDQGGTAKFLNYCLYEMLKMQRFDDGDDDVNGDGDNDDNYDNDGDDDDAGDDNDDKDNDNNNEEDNDGDDDDAGSVIIKFCTSLIFLFAAGPD